MYTGPGKYQHYKGGRYLVLGVALHTETGEPMVFYTPELPVGSIATEMWCRPLASFNGVVEGIAGTNIAATPRFYRVLT